MQKVRFMALFLVLAVLLCACNSLPEAVTLQPTTQVHEPETTENPVTLPTEATLPVVTEPETEPSQPEHSELYHPDYALQQIIEYFEEVVLNVEYGNGTEGDNLVQKWLAPIYYRVYGLATDEDKEALCAICEQLNGIPGFPGIYPAVEGTPENVSISFLRPDAFRDSFSDVVNGEDAYGAAQHWYYTVSNELHTARIGCRIDIDQNTRNSVLPEEIVNILGLSDTILRPDSITYQYSDDNTTLSEVDLLILKLLYSPEIQCGFDADTCAAIIQKLYY